MFCSYFLCFIIKEGLKIFSPFLVHVEGGLQEYFMEGMNSHCEGLPPMVMYSTQYIPLQIFVTMH